MNGLPAGKVDEYVYAEAVGYATAEQLAALESDRRAWRASLLHLLKETEESLAETRRATFEARDQAVADLEAELRQLGDAWARLTGERVVVERSAPRATEPDEPDADVAEDLEPGPVQLQVSWEPGRVVAWAAGRGSPSGDHDAVAEMLTASEAPSTGWNRHPPVPLPDGGHADALAIPVGDVLGWLVAAGAGSVDEDVVDDLAPSLRWLGRVAIWAVELTANGAMVPLLRQRQRQRQRQRGKGGGNDTTGSYSVRWTPSLIDTDRMRRMAGEMPGAMLALDLSVEPEALIRSALTGMVDAICRDAARSVDVPAAPPHVRNASDVAEAYLGRLDGSAFDAPIRVGSEVVSRIERWARPVTSDQPRLVVQLDPPDGGDAWHLAALAPTPGGGLLSVEEAIAQPGSKPREIDEQMSRLERMVPVLLRPGGMRRGQVIVSPDEAWEIMTTIGPRVAAAGFDVRVPALSRRNPTPSLRVMAETSGSAVAGINQLANVRWSVLFDDVELSAADITRLAREAMPLIRSGGRWVALDQADLKAAAEALAERANKTQMTGGEMLRLALGLEGMPLAGGVSVGGNSWAADLLQRAAELSGDPAPAPQGFVGDLRSYQGEALAWLGFLDSAGLGGCLALDMGLGKTPTMLAHLQAGVGSGPSLVVAPPAVVGNWAAEAARFTPGLRVVVHHGTSRASAEDLAAEVASADVVITTYGTAVRDVEAIEQVQWSRLVLDEAQAIKNPANDTSQQLRRIQARTRVALTGTPIENGLGDLWAILDFANPGLVGGRPQFIASLSRDGNDARVQGEDAMRALNGILVFRRTKAEPSIAAELPDKIDELDHCSMTHEQVGLYQAVLDKLVLAKDQPDGVDARKGQILAAITALKQICNHPSAFQRDDKPLAGRSGKLARLEEIVDSVFAAGEKVLVFTHFAEWGQRLAEHLTERMQVPIECYHGGLSRTARDTIIEQFQQREGPAALVLSLKAGGTGLNLTAASHVVLYDRWWNPAVEDQARDRAWRIGQTRTVISHRLICPGTVDERVEEVVEGKRRIADMVLPKSSSLADLDADQLRVALGLRPGEVLTAEDEERDDETEDAVA